MDENCSDFNNADKICESCKENFIRSKDKLKCFPKGDFENCELPGNDGDHCYTCEEGYGLY